MGMNQVQILEIPCGKGGLNSIESIGEYPVTDLKNAESICFEDDTWKKEGGSLKINTTVISGAPKILGLWDFWPAGSQKRIALTSDGKIISVVTGGIGDTLKSGLGANQQGVFVESLGSTSTRKLFCFNGYDTPQVTSDGVTATAMSKPAASWAGTSQPPGGVAHNGRLWAWLNHTIYFSTLADHENFQDSGSGSLSCYPGEGEKIIAAWSFAGRLYVWKYPRGIYWVDDSSTTVIDWKCKRLTKAIGMAGPLGLAQTENDVLFMSTEGFIQSLQAVQEYGESASVQTGSILPLKLANFIRSSIATNRILWNSAIWYGFKRELQISYGAAGYTVNNRRLILDLHDPENPKYRISSQNTCESLALTRDSSGIDRPMAGDDAGFVWILDQTGRNKQGAAYLAQYETDDVEIAEKGTRRANLQFLEAIFKPEGDHFLNIDVYLDGVYSQTIQFSMAGVIGGALGSFVLGTDTLGGGTIKNLRHRLYGDARRIKLRGYNSGINEEFSISSHLVGFFPGNERVQT